MAVSSTLVFRVKRSEPQLVAPENPTPREIKKLSDIDDQESLRFHVPVLLFYRNNPAMNGKDPVVVIREGLAKALDYYYPCAGRIVEGDNRKLLINCNGKGVMFVEADANIKLEQLGDSILPPCPFLEEFLYDVPGSGDIIGGPPFLIQVTRFACGGYVFGIRLNHTMADGAGLSQFLTAITEFSKGASAPSVLPVWKREEYLSARSPPRITCKHNEYEQIPYNISSTSNIVMNPDNFVRTSVFFNPKDIQALRDQYMSSSENFHRRSRFDLITACLWKCRTIALNPQDPSQVVRLAAITNVRGKPGLNIPAGYYGNAFVYPAAMSPARILCTSPISYAVDLIKKVKAQVDEEYVQSVADFMVIKNRPGYAAGWIFIVSDITHLGFDKVDFGWGTPIYGGVPFATSDISFYSNFKNNKGEDGVVVSTCLPLKAVDTFKYEIEKMINYVRVTSRM